MHREERDESEMRCKECERHSLRNKRTTRWPVLKKTYHELFFDLAQTLDTRGELEVVVRTCFRNCRNNSDPIPLRADVVGGRDAGDIDICVLEYKPSCIILTIKSRSQGKEREVAVVNWRGRGEPTVLPSNL